jgi:eukaryotic-like serine/threonine-protein kinase
MGVVYRAHDTLLERIVALKVIATTINDNPELHDRFFREARAAGQLSHRNIITIHDLGEHEGQPYLAMEFLRGEDLQRRLSRPEPMSLGRKLEVASEVCDGLAYAHRRGVIHRDIKPANIFITDEGVVKILDFGLARMVASEVTASYMMLGTLNYMAPEQVRGERTDHRADIFSFGVVFYEILSGKKAFQGDSYATTLYKILQDAPEPLLTIDATLPPEVVRIVEKTLAKPRDERYQDLTDVARDLAILRQHLLMGDAGTITPAAPATHRVPSDPPRSVGLTPPPVASTDTTVAHRLELPPGRRVGRLSAILLVLVLIAAGSFAAWLKFRRSSESAPPVSVAAPTPTPAPPSSPTTALPPPPASSSPTQPPAASGAPPPSPAESRVEERRNANAARAEMVRAKTAARQAGPLALKSPSYVAAAAAEREGARLFQADRFSEAAAKFYQASGLFHSAELTATTAPPAEPERPQQQAPPAPTPQSTTPANTPPEPAAQPPAQQPPAQQPPAQQPAPVTPAPRPPDRSEPAPAPAPAAPLPPPPRLDVPAASPQDGLRELLRRYEQALESRSIEAMRRIWPTLGGAQEDAIRREFANARQIDVTIEDPEITISATTATITFIRRYRLWTVDGQKPVTNSRTMISAHRSGNDWMIERVRFEALK